MVILISKVNILWMELVSSEKTLAGVCEGQTLMMRTDIENHPGGLVLEVL